MLIYTPRLVPLPGRLQRRLVAHVGDVRPREPGREGRQPFGVVVGLFFCSELAQVDLGVVVVRVELAQVLCLIFLYRPVIATHPIPPLHPSP